MKFFDSHCHLQFEAFDELREQIISEMQKNNSRTINVGSSIENSETGIKLAEKYSDVLISSVGVHPFHSLGFEIYEDKDESHNLKNIYPQNLNKLKELAKNPVVKAIGECGIDFSYFNHLKGSENDIINWKQKQIECFRFQIKLAKKLNLPLILHIRNEYKLALTILEEENFDGQAIFHFFKGNISEMEEILKSEKYFFGFSGVITYDDTMTEVIKMLPMSKIMIETDAPYVSPIPFKREINQPKYVVKVAEKIAEIKNNSINEILNATFENAIRFFGI